MSEKQGHIRCLPIIHRKKILFILKLSTPKLRTFVISFHKYRGNFDELVVRNIADTCLFKNVFAHIVFDTDDLSIKKFPWLL